MKKLLEVKRILKESTDKTVGGFSWIQGISFTVLSNGDIIWASMNDGYIYLNDTPQVELNDVSWRKFYKTMFAAPFSGNKSLDLHWMITHEHMKKIMNVINPKIRRTKKLVDGRFWNFTIQGGNVVAFRGQENLVIESLSKWYLFIFLRKTSDHVWLDIPKKGKPILLTWEELRHYRHQSDPDQDARQSMRNRMLGAAGIHESTDSIKPTDLDDIEDAWELGGTHPIQTGYTKDRKKKLIKPHHEDFRAHGDYAASKIGRYVNPDMPNVNVRRHGEQLASEQDWVEGEPFIPRNPHDLSPNDIQSFVEDSVLNWVIGNHDAHRRQFMRTAKGNLVGIDKTQAFKHYGRDELSLDYHPNARFGEDQPYIYYILDAWRNGEIDVKIEWFSNAIRKLQSIPDEEFVSYIRPYAESVANHFSGVSSDAILKTALDRKHSLGNDYSNFLSGLFNKPIVLEGKREERWYWTKQKGVPADVFDYIAKEWLPNGKIKYLNRLLKNSHAADIDWNQFIANTDSKSKDVHDIERAMLETPIFHQTYKALERFDKALESGYIPKDRRDINNDLYDYSQIIDAVAIQALAEKSNADDYRELQNAKGKVEYNGWLIIPIESKEQSCKYGKGTKWCISATNDNQFDAYKYSKGVTFYFLISIKNHEKFALLIYPSGIYEIWEANDTMLGEGHVDSRGILDPAFNEDLADFRFKTTIKDLDSRTNESIIARKLRSI
jgi:hypothetical protein